MDQQAVCAGSDWTDHGLIMSIDVWCVRSVERRSNGHSKHSQKISYKDFAEICQFLAKLNGYGWYIRIIALRFDNLFRIDCTFPFV